MQSAGLFRCPNLIFASPYSHLPSAQQLSAEIVAISMASCLAMAMRNLIFHSACAFIASDRSIMPSLGAILLLYGDASRQADKCSRCDSAFLVLGLVG